MKPPVSTRDLQQLFAAHGYYEIGFVDGEVGPKTTSALDRILKAHKIGKSLDGKRDTTKAVQALLGVDTDGIWGAKTDAAFDEWQATLLPEQVIAKRGTTEFSFGRSSRNRLNSVIEPLQRVIERGLQLSPKDFGVSSGYRSAEEQAQLFADGASQLDGVEKLSRHQYRMAVDVFPIIAGKAQWNAEAFFPVIDAIAQAGQELGLALEWGGAWVDMSAGFEARRAYEGYAGRFPDCPHVEIPEGSEPSGYVGVGVRSKKRSASAKDGVLNPHPRARRRNNRGGGR